MPALACLSLFTVNCPRVIAQTDKATNPERPPIHFQVLQGWKADLGDHAIFLNRVAPPVLPTTPPPAPAPTAEEIAAAKSAQTQTPRKKSEMLFLSATVYAHQYTEIGWTDGGHTFRAYSNIDFNLLTGAGAIESADTVYSLLLAVSNTSRQPGRPPQADPSQDSAVGIERIPDLGKLSATKAQYLIAEDETGITPQAKDLAALDALHLFYDANRQQLAEAYAQREAARIEEGAKPKAQPPKPPDTVVNFWPGKNTVIIEGNSKAIK